MSSCKPLTIAIVVFMLTGGLAAQQPPRTGEPARSDSPRNVTLSLTEYNRLIDLAGRPRQTPPSAPVAAVLASADLRVRVERDTAQGVFSLTGDVLRSGINRVALVSGATLVEGHADGRPLPLTADANGHAALLPGPGPFAITLGWGAPLTFAPGRASFVLPVPAAGTTHATIDLPGEQADVHLSAGVVTRRSAQGGRTIVEATLRPGTSTDVWWSMRDSAPIAAAREVRMLADVLTLVTIGDSDARMAALVDVTVVQGEPRTLDLRLPGGYELAGISGAAVESSEPRDGGVVLTLTDPTVRRHQFLVTLERTHAGGSFAMDTDFIQLPGVQRERGEIAIEGLGTLELNVAERTGMHRIDVRELNAALHSLARLPILAAVRYQRSAGAQIALAMDVRRFAAAGVLAAVADRAVATTLITAEGRALTEIVLHVRNRAQPFLKVTLPAGATIVSVEVAGETAKPVIGADGTRVPLLRPGFRPSGVYSVSYVYVHAAAPLDRKGALQMALPRMDIPVGVVEWEMLVPDRYVVHAVDGNVIDRAIVAAAERKNAMQRGIDAEIAGVVGGVEGVVTGGVAGGARGATAGESVTVAGFSGRAAPSAAPAPPPITADSLKTEPSQNVINLQRRAAGVLPIHMDVPRAGTSHRFVKPLVVDQEATVMLRYKRR